MNPPLVLKEGRLLGACGTPCRKQVTFQIATAMADFGLDPNRRPKCHAGPRWNRANLPTTPMTALML